jgi:opacity protein-like surface antigen
MVWTRKVAVLVVAASVVLAQSVAVVSAAPKDSSKSEQASGGNGQSDKGQSGKGQSQKGGPAATEGEVPAEEELPECPADEQPADEEPAGEQPADEQPADEQPADEQPADEQPADDEDESACSPPSRGSKGKANVNLTGKGKAAEHNPNVGADGQLNPGQASGKTTDAEAEAAKAEKVASVKAESRTKAKDERAKGEKGAYLVYVNGEKLNLTPIARNGRTLVPFRVLAEYLGAEVSWEPSTSTVTMVKDGHTVVLSIGSNVAYVDGQPVELQAAPELNESRTFVPLRFIAEALGADVDYDPETGAITVITLPGQEPATPPAEDPATPPADGEEGDDDTTTPPADGEGDDDTTTPPADAEEGDDDTTTPPAEGGN